MLPALDVKKIPHGPKFGLWYNFIGRRLSLWYKDFLVMFYKYRVCNPYEFCKKGVRREHGMEIYYGTQGLVFDYHMLVISMGIIFGSSMYVGIHLLC